jgi:hypothetical protein
VNNFSAENMGIGLAGLAKIVYRYKWDPPLFTGISHAVRPVPDFSLTASLPTWQYFQAVASDHTVKGR